MLLTSLLSASPLAVPQLIHSSSTRREVITQVGPSAGRQYIHNHHLQSQFIRKLRNWSEKPPDINPKLLQRKAKDLPHSLLYPNQMHQGVENYKKKIIDFTDPETFTEYGTQNLTNYARTTPTSIVKHMNNTDIKSVYFGRSFISHSPDPVSNDQSNNNSSDSLKINNKNNINLVSNNEEKNYSKIIQPLHIDAGSAYINDASILEAKDYNELQTNIHLQPSPPQFNNQHQSNANTQTNETSSNIKIVAWILAAIIFSILGLIVGVFFGAPTSSCIQTHQHSTSASGGSKTSAAKSSARAKSVSSNRSTKHLIKEETHTLYNPKEQVSKEKRDLTRKPDYSVPMLSVQTPGCAGMERLGVPTRTSITVPSTRDEKTRRRREGGNNESSSSSILSGATSSTTTKSNQYSNHPYSSGVSPTKTLPMNSNKNLEAQYPHHIPLPDGECGDDRHLQIRNTSQQSEIPRTYPTPPPNKTVYDLPGQLNNKPTSTSASNLHDQFGSGRSIANASSTSAPVSKIERSKHNSKIISFLLRKPNSNKLGNEVSLGQPQTTSRSSNNNQYMSNLPTILQPSSSAISSPTFTNNPPLKHNIGSSHLLNITSLPVPPQAPNHHHNYTSDHLAVSQSLCNNLLSSSSSSSGNSNVRSNCCSNNKPISCPSHSSPIEEAASLDDVEENSGHENSHGRSADTRILSSSLESTKTSSLFM